MVRTLTSAQKKAGWRKEKAQIKRTAKKLQSREKARETKERKSESSRMRGLGYKKSARGTWG